MQTVLKAKTKKIMQRFNIRNFNNKIHAMVRLINLKLKKIKLKN